MNPVIELLLQRRSVRAYEDRTLAQEAKDQILEATLRAPTAGNLMLYSIVEISDQRSKDDLARLCDNQPFIARAPWVVLFAADYQRWHDLFAWSGVEETCRQAGEAMRNPEVGDLLLACADALIAAQTAVIAAESLGIGSCYIGDIMENCERTRDLLGLTPYVFPICLLCFGYPDARQAGKERSSRFERKFICFENKYRRLTPAELAEMTEERQRESFKGHRSIDGAANLGQLVYKRKFAAGFSLELNRSVQAMIRRWTAGGELP